jgi:hypothetical protein
MLMGSHRTYVIVDALDECTERQDLLVVLYEILRSDSVQVNVLLLSREEEDIKEGIRAAISINLECPGIDGDIERHINRCLENDIAWRNDPSYVKQEIRDALMKGARGM